MEIFESGNYKFISELVEEKISILKNNIDFIIELFYKTEEYYFALSYSLGVKYGEDLKKI